jgi:hypothetical protein
MIPAKLPLKITRGTTFKPVIIHCKDKDGAAVDISGWTPFAEVRKSSCDSVVVDLAPTVTDGPAGEITIPAIQDETTVGYTAGDYFWDLILETPAGERLGPYVADRFAIRNKITQPA